MASPPLAARRKKLERTFPVVVEVVIALLVVHESLPNTRTEALSNASISVAASKLGELKAKASTVECRVTTNRPAAACQAELANSNVPATGESHWLQAPHRVHLADSFCVHHPLDNFCLPNFELIGAQKSGTTTLKVWLSLHPALEILPHEHHYFDKAILACGSATENCKPQVSVREFLSDFAELPAHIGKPYGFKTPAYLFNPWVPKLIKRYMPWMKHIVILRNPVERTYSGYGQAWSLRYLKREKASTNCNGLALALQSMKNRERLTSRKYAELFHCLVNQEILLIAEATRLVFNTFL